MKYDIIDYTTPNEEDDDIIFNIKKNIKKLTDPEKLILITYLEDGTYASVAYKYNVSKPTAKTYINKLIKKITKTKLKIYNK